MPFSNIEIRIIVIICLKFNAQNRSTDWTRQTDRQRAQRHLVIINGRKEIQNLTYE